MSNPQLAYFNIQLSNNLDVRNIISDDESLQEGVLPALKEYNLAQFITVDVPGTNYQVRNYCLSEFLSSELRLTKTRSQS